MEETPLKSYYLYELAALYEVSVNTQRRWIRKYAKELKQLGWRKNQKRYTVSQVEFLFEKLGRP